MRVMMTSDTKEKKVTVKQSEEGVGDILEYFYSRKVPQEALQVSFFNLAGFYELALFNISPRRSPSGCCPW